MRLPYTPNPPSTSSPTEADILSRVLARRGGTLIPLDLTLLHAPLIADGFNAFFGAIRTKNSLPADVRELAFCRVAALHGCEYEWEIHSPIAREAGLGDEALRSVKSLSGEKQGLDERQSAVMDYADAMTRDVKVGDDVFGRVRAFFEDQQMVELTVSIAGFNTVTRVCVALDVGEKNEK